MQFQIFAILSAAIMASALPAAIPNNPPPACSSPGQVLACCSSFSGSYGVNCIFSSKNFPGSPSTLLIFPNLYLNHPPP